jgi:di/tricarboxylate transporter
VTLPILLTLLVAVGAVALFVWDRLRMDVVGLIVMGTLMVTGLVSLRQGISGFANEALVTVAAMFVLSAGLVRTGTVDSLGKWLGRVAGESEFRLLVLSLGVVIPLSAFINNTPVVVVMIPIVLGLARSMGARPSKLLMPISFASQMGGTLTLIGTSTNLLVAGLVLDLGMDRIRLFDVTPPALVLTVIGVVYLLTAGRWLTPVRETSRDLIKSYELRDYLTGLVVEPDSPLVGKSLGEARFASEYGLEVVVIERKGRRVMTPDSSTVIRAGDLLLAEGKVEDIARIEEDAHLKIATPSRGLLEGDEADSEEERPQLAELLVSPRSRAAGSSIRRLRFRQRYGVPVLGVQRHGTPLRERVRDVTLVPGDLLLVRGLPQDLRRIHEGRDFALLGAVERPVRRREKRWLAVAIFAAVVGLAAVNVMPILLSAVLGVIAMFLTGCVTPEEAYQEVDWMVLVLLGSIIPLGIAMQNTGAAGFVADHLLRLTAAVGPVGALAAVYLVTLLFTAVISNNATAVVFTPIAIAAARELDVSPLPFVVAVMIAASNSYMTPVGYQTNTFIYAPGGYRFSDFLHVGGPLNLIMLVAAALVIPIFFPF